MKNTIIIVAPSDDIHALAVKERIEVLSSGALNVVIFDLATFPNFSDLSLSSSATGEFRVDLCPALPFTYANKLPNESEFRSGSTIVEVDNIRSVWWRRPRSPSVSNLRSKLLTSYCIGNMSDFLISFFSILSQRGGVGVYNTPQSEYMAARKPFQFSLADSIGLTQPETIITNCESEAKLFVDRLKKSGRNVIYKQVRDVNGVGNYTRRLDAEAESRMHQIKKSPVILQEEISGGKDIRLTIIGSKAYAMAQVRKENGSTIPDIRLDSSAESFRCDLPGEFLKAMFEMHKMLGLDVCSYDIMTDSNDVHYFIEANPSGQWLFVEEETGFPLSECFAHFLIFGEADRFEQRLPSFSREDLVEMGRFFCDGVFDRAV